MINKVKYPDGSSYVKQSDIKPEITFKINSYEDLWTLNQYVDVCNNNGIKPYITIPNLLDAQADRRFNSNESFNLKLVLQQLINMNAYFQIFHPHNSEVVEMAFGIVNKGNNLKIIDNSNYIYEVLANLKKNYDFNAYDMEANLVLMSSDAGGFKPLMKLCDKLNWIGEVASASKSREYKDGKTILTQLIAHNDFRGKDILIIDDICVYGGTFKGLAKILRERNCGKLYLAISHMTIQNLGEDPVTNYFDKVFTTNSKFDYYHAKGPDPLNKQSIELIYAPQNLEIIKLF